MALKELLMQLRNPRDAQGRALPPVNVPPGARAEGDTRTFFELAPKWLE